MKVELRKQTGKCIQTGRLIEIKGQDSVVVDGQRVGVIGWHPGAPILMNGSLRWSPAELATIESEVQKIRTNDAGAKPKAVQPPLVPKELLKGMDDDGIAADDID